MHVLRVWIPAEGITDAAIELEWGAYDSRGQLLEQGAAPLAALPESARTELIVPFARVLLTQVSLPRQNRRQLLRVVPFALEDRLLSSPENSHCALGEAVAGQWPVAVVERSWLAGLLEQVRAVRPVHAVWPGWYWLPPGSTLWDGSEGWCRSQMHQGDYVVEAPAADDLLAATYTWTQLDWRQRQPDAAAINLLQGSFASQPRSAGSKNPWRLTAALAAAVLLLAWGQLAWQVWQGQAQQKQLTAQLRSGFYKVFPASASMVDPLLQVERRLQEQAAGPSAAPADDFMSLLRQVAPLARTAGPIKSIEYREGELQMQVQASASAADALASGLNKRGVQAQVQPAGAADQPQRISVRAVQEAS